MSGAPGLNVHLDLSGDMPRLKPNRPKSRFTALCRKCLTNAAKYANATEIFVLLRKTGTDIELDIRDNGSGFEPSQT